MPSDLPSDPALQPQLLPDPLRQALDALLVKAPAHLVPRARGLYFNKYPLEGLPEELDGSPSQRFRTFVLRDTTCLPAEGEEAITRLNELAVVHWQAPQTNAEDYAAYVRQRWQLPAERLQVSLELVEEPWFRDGGAYARLIVLPPPAGPAPAAAAPGSTP
ncbi:hypothetical protein [Cyanobium sp. CH-040]|uniref:hypothetical protein n=1 Tax=Cyanobium sp. CH-040 TaxID=2823708 RepID=UPI0020CE5F42|nr:hypothetical protein [Cyanobium sp. CH-040]MCP9928740.1 hypothetical protein [Cyanobium sp. CH-040]